VSTDRASSQATAARPPSRHQLALMIWLAVVPTLIVLNVALSTLLEGVPIVLRTLIVATIAVPIVMYGLMPRLHRLRGLLVARQPRVSAVGNESR
jgi:antibiotic biosynthesis monooxygenase (ABM) superfamily enzyme